MTRAGIILAAIFLMTPVWLAAQDSSAALVDAASDNIIGEAYFDQSYMIAASQSLDRWARISQPLGVAAKLKQQLSSQPGTARPISQSRQAPVKLWGDSPTSGIGNSVASPIGEFEHPADGAACVAEKCCSICGMRNTVQPDQSDSYGFWLCEDCGSDVQGRPAFGPNHAFRFGWWGVDFEGSPVKVGEFQGLQASPFWDLDGIWTDGSRTFNYTMSGLDSEANDARAYYYGGPQLAVNFEYERFLHRLDHVPLAGFDLNSGTPGPADKVVAEDLNVGDDYAIRVQQLDARVQGRLTNNLKWKVDLWGMRKSGERQANAMAHCFNVNPPPGAANYTCHVLSQQQNIDWTTMEVKPVVEAKIGNAVVEYSRTMRAFGQNDQVVERTYTAFDYSPTFGTEGPSFAYAWVPENFTQIDRLKLNVPIDEANQLYTHLYLGDTENKFRGTHRGFYGYDVRLTNRAINDVTTTAYAKLDAQNNQIPTDLLTTPPFGVNTGSPGSFEPSSLRHPVEYNSSRVGIKGTWQSRARNRLSVAGGYEYVELARDYADYNTLSGPFTQEDTQTHKINIGPYFRVSPTLDTFVRYKGRFIDNPLIGVRESDGNFNTNQPEQEHLVEIGGTWSPTYNFMATALFGIENSWNDSQYANFNEDNYPIIFTAWYAPTTRLSLTTGYAYFSNWIDQDITIGFQDNPTETTPWDYSGYNSLVSFGANYAWTPCTQLVGGFEWNRGSNVFSVPPSPAGANWTALPTFSDVIVETTRVNVGVEHEFAKGTTAYFRYVHFDYEDLSVNYNSGTTNMFLGGFTMLR